ncbi:MAG: hypothetical protein LBE36_01425 [Flavobacteriaceae bacterium]|jgi:hypothetical protein|nr:hypothetical protein [Flavobacteriaceae bacterium]
MQKTAYKGTDFMPFSKLKFLAEMSMEYGNICCEVTKFFIRAAARLM